MFFQRDDHIQRCEIVTGVVEVEGLPEEVKTEQGADKAARGLLSVVT